MQVTRRSRVRRMDIGMGIDPDHPEPFTGPGHPDAGDSPGCNAVITTNYNGKFIIFDCGSNLPANPFGHGKHAGYPLCITIPGRFEKQMIFGRNRNTGMLFEKSAAKVERSDANGIRAQACTASPGSDFGPYFYQLQFMHTRSEEHTSELQSLMRISYAVFCLKKKKN